MAADFPHVYPYSRQEAQRRKEERLYTDSFKTNVSCARAVECAVRDHCNGADGDLTEGCALSVLEQYGFKRVNFVLANSISQLDDPDQISNAVRQWGQRTFVPPDRKYNIYFAVNAAAPRLESFIRQAQEAYRALGLFGPEHCTGDRHEQDYAGKVLVMSPDTLRESCWDPRNQLWYGEGGFGCTPHARGQAVFATCLGDGEQTRWNRSDFAGVLDEQYLPDWAREKLEELRSLRQEPEQSGPIMGGMG